jgi:GxxExxY protein
MSELLFEKESYAIRGAAFEVYNEMGSGFTEGIYDECMQIVFEDEHISFDAQPSVPVYFRKRQLKKRFVPDFICYGTIVVEIKAIDRLTGRERSQMLNYLKATGYKLGFLINFGSKEKIEIERVVL